MMKKISFIALFSVFSIFSCSRIELATSWADSYITSHIDDYFDISSMQTQLIKKSLKEDIVLVRQKIFPRVASEFQSILNMINSNAPLNTEAVVKYSNNLKKIFKDSLIIFEVGAQEFANKLESRQLGNFKKEFDKKTKELVEISSDQNIAKKKRYEKLEKQFVMWLGRLNSEQEAELQRYVKENSFPLKEQILNREKLSNEFIETFPDIEKRKNFIHNIFYDYEAVRDPNYNKAIKEEEARLFELIVFMANKMNVAQKKHLTEMLVDRIDQFEKASQNKKAQVF